MNDFEIRTNIHNKILYRHHKNAKTLVVDEFGLNNGDCRADIAVINGHLCGFEIKSNKDNLNRLERQVSFYDAVFDYSTIIVEENHYKKINEYVPDWWGILLCEKGKRGAVNFNTVRKSQKNLTSNPDFIVKLLWRDEIIGILQKKGVSEKVLKQPKYKLYDLVVSVSSKEELNKFVRMSLKERKNWRCHKPLSQYDDLSQPFSM